MKIYTKTGDKGETSLFGGQRVKKNHKRLFAYGSLDELNSFIGLSRAHLSNLDDLKTFLAEVQGEILCIGSHLATESEDLKAKLPPLPTAGIENLENWIDQMEGELPQLKSFILPAGSVAACHLHVARTIARRSERLIVDLLGDENIADEILTYVNRLSDFLFVAARYANFKNGGSDEAWNTK